eukprot:6202096-Pleurochrysis_carterae.AAC.2
MKAMEVCNEFKSSSCSRVCLGVVEVSGSFACVKDFMKQGALWNGLRGELGRVGSTVLDHRTPVASITFFSDDIAADFSSASTQLVPNGNQN